MTYRYLVRPDDMSPPGNVQLSERDRLVLLALAAGKTNQEIAHAYRVTPSRIGNRLMRLRKLYGASTTAHLVALAIRKGHI